MSQSFSDSIIQAVHCQGRQYPECNCQLFSLWINPKENSRPRSAQTGFSPAADRWISIYEAKKTKTLCHKWDSTLMELSAILKNIMKAPIYSCSVLVFLHHLVIPIDNIKFMWQQWMETWLNQHILKKIFLKIHPNVRYIWMETHLICKCGWDGYLPCPAVLLICTRDSDGPTSENLPFL